MKRLYYIATLAIALFASVPMQAQEEAGLQQAKGALASLLLMTILGGLALVAWGGWRIQRPFGLLQVIALA